MEQKRQQSARIAVQIQRDSSCGRMVAGIRILEELATGRNVLASRSLHAVWNGHLVPTWLQRHKRRVTNLVRQQLRLARDARLRAFFFVYWRDHVEALKNAQSNRMNAREVQNEMSACAHYAARWRRIVFRRWQVILGEKVHEEARARLRATTLRFIALRDKKQHPTCEQEDTWEAVELLNLPTAVTTASSSSSGNPWVHNVLSHRPMELPGDDCLGAATEAAACQNSSSTTCAGAPPPTSRFSAAPCERKNNSTTRGHEPRTDSNTTAEHPFAHAAAATPHRLPPRPKSRQPWDPRPKTVSRQKREPPPHITQSREEPAPQNVLDMERRASERRERHQALLELKEQKRIALIQAQEEEDQQQLEEEFRRAQTHRAQCEHLRQLRVQYQEQLRTAATHYASHLLHRCFVALLKLHSERAQLLQLATQYHSTCVIHVAWRVWWDWAQRRAWQQAIIAQARHMIAMRQYVRNVLTTVWDWFRWVTIDVREGMEQRKRVEMLKARQVLHAWNGAAEDMAFVKVFRARELSFRWILCRSVRQWVRYVEEIKVARHKESLWGKVQGWLKEME